MATTSLSTVTDCSPLRVGVGDVDAVAGDLRAGDLRAEPDIQPLLLEMPQGFFRELLVGHRQEIWQRLEHRPPRRRAGARHCPAPDR